MADDKPTSIAQQIAQAADLYAPNVYYNLLSQNVSLGLVLDPMGQQFIPVSDAYFNSDAKKKLFVVGIIPPNAQVTGKKLDRSNANPIPNTTSASTTINPGQNTTTVPGADGVTATDRGAAVKNTLTIQQAGAAISAAYTQRFGHPPTKAELGIYVSQSYKETEDGRGGLVWPDNNPGYIGNWPGSKIPNGQQTFLHGDGRYYAAYPTAQQGAAAFVSTIYKTGGDAAIAAAQAGDANAYAQALHNGGYMEDPVSDYAGTIAQNQAYITGRVGHLKNPPLPDPINIQPSDAASPATGWKDQGSSAAASATASAAIGSNTNLSNTTTTAQKFQQAQQAMVLATRRLLANLANTPPLQFLVNPSSFKVNNEKVVSTGNWTRYGPANVVEHWGDGQDKIEGSGKVAAFMAIDISGETAQAPGLTRTARHYSASFQNFLSLYQIYKNNAGLYMPDGIDSNQLNITMLGSIYIYYDHTMYIGSFDELTMSEADTAPYTIEYSFTFTVRATFLLDMIPDPNHTYGVNNSTAQLTTQMPATIPTTQAATVAQGQPQPQLLPNGDINTANQSTLTFAQLAQLNNAKEKM
jgi:hypothetical protein